MSFAEVIQQKYNTDRCYRGFGKCNAF